MTTVQETNAMVSRPKVWPLSVKAYHALSEMGLIPEKTELLYGQVYHKTPKSPCHSNLFMRLFQLLLRAVPPELQVRPEQPITCGSSEPEPDLSVVRCAVNEY